MLSKYNADSIVPANALTPSQSESACSTSLTEPANDTQCLIAATADSNQQPCPSQPAKVVAAVRYLSAATDSRPTVTTGLADVPDGIVSTIADSSTSSSGFPAAAAAPSPPLSHMHDSSSSLLSCNEHQALPNGCAESLPSLCNISNSFGNTVPSNPHQSLIGKGSTTPAVPVAQGTTAQASTGQVDQCDRAIIDASHSLANTAQPMPATAPSPAVVRLANGPTTTVATPLVSGDLKPVVLQRCTSWSSSLDPRDRLLLCDLSERRRTADNIPSNIIDQLPSDGDGILCTNALSEELAHIFRRRASICADHLTDCDQCFGVAADASVAAMMGSSLSHDMSGCDSPVSLSSCHSPVSVPLSAGIENLTLTAHDLAASTLMMPRVSASNGAMQWKSGCPLPAESPSPTTLCNDSNHIVQIARRLRQVNTKDCNIPAVVQVALPSISRSHTLLASTLSITHSIQLNSNLLYCLLIFNTVPCLADLLPFLFC